MSDTLLQSKIAIRPLDAEEAEARLDELAHILVDAVAHGASVNFLSGLSQPEGRTFWATQLPGLVAGDKRLFVADDGERLVGTVLLMNAPQPNAPHRADVGKMLVLSSLRRQGLGRRLLETVEEAALASGHWLLLLDTESGSAGEMLYRSRGWIECGRIPDYFIRTDGVIAGTTLFYKKLR